MKRKNKVEAGQGEEPRNVNWLAAFMTFYQKNPVSQLCSHNSQPGNEERGMRTQFQGGVHTKRVGFRKGHQPTESGYGETCSVNRPQPPRETIAVNSSKYNPKKK